MAAWSTRRTPIGLDLGQQQVKAVQLRGRPGAWTVAAAAAFPRLKAGGALDAGEVRRLDDILFRQGFTGRRVVLAVPPDKLMAGNLELPPRSSGAPVDQLARMELARVHRCDPESFEMACWELPAGARSGDTSRMIALGCAHADAEALLSVFEEQGFQVASLEAGACALGRACVALAGASAGIAAVLDIGFTSAQVVLLCQGQVSYQRKLADLGVRPVQEALAAQLALQPEEADLVLSKLELDLNQPVNRSGDMPEVRRQLAALAEALSAELRVAFSYALHRYADQTVQALLLVGGGASLHGLAEHLGQTLGVTARVAAPKDLARCPAGLLPRCSDPILTTAFGLALSQER